MIDVTGRAKAAIWTGRVLKILLVLFLLFDSSMKIIHHPQAIKASEEIGLHEACLSFLGIYLLIATVLYAVPRTSFGGGLFITAYLGGAAAATYIASLPGHPYFFPVVFCVLLWVAEYLQNPRLRMILPLGAS